MRQIQGRIRRGLGRIGGESRSPRGWRRVVLEDQPVGNPPRCARDDPRIDTISRMSEARPAIRSLPPTSHEHWHKNWGGVRPTRWSWWSAVMVASVASTTRHWTCGRLVGSASPGRATSSQILAATGGPTWGRQAGRCWGRMAAGRRRCGRRGGGSGGKPIIESQAPRHDGKKTDGGTLKNLARATMWLLVISRSPFRIAESVDCEIPTAFESAICL